jgi:hypothetical protein
MNTRARFLRAALAVTVLTAGLASPVAACLTPYRPAEHFDRADVVVTGVAVDRRVGNIVEAVMMLSGGLESPFDVVYEIAVDQVEEGKGHLRNQERVTLHLDGMTSCAQRLELGHRYRLGATEHAVGLSVPFGAIEELELLPGPQPQPALSGDIVRVTALDLLPIPLALAMLVLLLAGLRLAWGHIRRAPGRTEP